jgi:hypothetical protein
LLLCSFPVPHHNIVSDNFMPFALQPLNQSPLEPQAVFPQHLGNPFPPIRKSHDADTHFAHLQISEGFASRINFGINAAGGESNEIRRLKSALSFCVINYDPACKRVGV